MEKSISIIIYMSCFAISLIFCKIYERYCIQRNYMELPWHKKLIWFLFIISGPVFISAIRYDVGTDYFAYINWFNNINSLPIDMVIQKFGNEPLYLILNKVAFILFKEPWGIFFLSSLLIHIFIIYGIDFFKEHLSMPMALFIYYMLHFNFGLNGIRQMIAISIVFYSLKFIYQRRPFKYGFFIVIATMFHNTALISILFYIIISYKYRGGSDNFIRKFFYSSVIVLSPIIVLLGLKILIKVPIFSQYEVYINSDFALGTGFLIDIIPIIIPVFIFRKQIEKKHRLLSYFIDLSLLNIPFRVSAYFIQWGSRLALYTNIFYYILPAILINSVNRKSNRRLIKLYYILYFILYYFINFVTVYNRHEVYPYKILTSFLLN